MHLISFDASPRQVSKLRNGHAVRIKKGAGFNLVVHPGNYHLVSRAFTKNKGVQLKLTPEEIETNTDLSPEQHDELGQEMDENLFEHLPFAEGGSIFSKIKRGVNKALGSKTAKHIGHALKPIGRELKNIGKEFIHQKIAEAHQAGVEKYGDNPIASKLMNIAADTAHSKVQGVGVRGGKLSLKQVGRTLKKAFTSKPAKQIGNVLKSTAKDLLHEGLSQVHTSGMSQYGQDPRMAGLMNVLANAGHQQISGLGLGAGLGVGLGAGMNAHDALRLANMATASANHQLAKMHNASVHGQLTQPPIKRYWDDAMAPPSRGTGMHNHYNMIRGRGSLLTADDILPPALQSQPYGANWHMQFFLPPQYHRYNDGGDMEGRGLYI